MERLPTAREQGEDKCLTCDGRELYQVPSVRAFGLAWTRIFLYLLHLDLGFAVLHRTAAAPGSGTVEDADRREAWSRHCTSGGQLPSGLCNWLQNCATAQ